MREEQQGKEGQEMDDGIPPRATWKKRELWFKNEPEDKHIVYHHDPWKLSRRYWVIQRTLNMWSIGRRRSLAMHLRARGYIMKCGLGTGGIQCRLLNSLNIY